jgi:hypothetical protein
VQGRICATAHSGNLVSYAEEGSELWQNLIGVVHKSAAEKAISPLQAVAMPIHQGAIVM